MAGSGLRYLLVAMDLMPSLEIWCFILYDSSSASLKTASLVQQLCQQGTSRKTQLAMKQAEGYTTLGSMRLPIWRYCC